MDEQKQNKVVRQFIESLATVIRYSPALAHLDISGMNMPGDGVLSIVVDGVKQSQTLAGFHFDGNRVDEWTRFRINAIMLADDADLYPEEGQNADLEASVDVNSIES